jgi:hypothetical protein
MSKDENGKPLPAVTNKVYNLATRNRVEKKRKALNAWATELRRIIGQEEIALPLAACPYFDAPRAVALTGRRFFYMAALASRSPARAFSEQC